MLSEVAAATPLLAVRVETPLRNANSFAGIGVLRQRLVRKGGRTSAQDDRLPSRDWHSRVAQRPMYSQSFNPR